MKAIIHTEFKALRQPKDKKNSVIEEGEVVEGDLAKAAIDNGFGEEVPDDTPVGREFVEPKPTQKPSKRKRDREGEGE